MYGEFVSEGSVEFDFEGLLIDLLVVLGVPGVLEVVLNFNLESDGHFLRLEVVPGDDQLLLDVLLVDLLVLNDGTHGVYDVAENTTGQQHGENGDHLFLRVLGVLLIKSLRNRRIQSLSWSEMPSSRT